MDNNKYNSEWIKKRAFESIHPIALGVWDYSDSLLLYISSGVEKYESLQENNTPYFRLVTKPEREYLQSIAKDVVALLPQKFEYVDLGPGTEHKEQFFFDEIKKQGKECTYIPVDISTYYLDLAEKHAQVQGISVRQIQASFEELASVLGEATVPRFVNIGLTFSNYEPHFVLSMLRDIAGKNGYAFINAQMRDRVDMKELRQIYAEDGTTLADDKIKLLGLDPQKDVTPTETNDRVELWSSIIYPSAKLKEMGINAGDKILLFQSLRYTPLQLKEELRKISEKFIVFDTGVSFIAALIQVDS